MIKNCIFDFGNVLAVFDPDKLTAPYVADKALRKEISDIVFDRLYWDRLDKGTITDDEVKEGIRSRVLPEHADLTCAVYDNWVKNLVPVKGMPEVIRHIKESGFNLYLLSNISTGFAHTYHEVEWIRELFKLFDGLVFSGEIKLTKPDAEIFRYTFEKFGLKSCECLFIDDSPVNIKGAEKIGLRGFRFDGNVKKLMKFFE